MSLGGLHLEGLIFGNLQYLLELEKKIIYLFVGIFSLAIIGVKVLSLQKLFCVSHIRASVNFPYSPVPCWSNEIQTAVNSIIREWLSVNF